MQHPQQLELHENTPLTKQSYHDPKRNDSASTFENNKSSFARDDLPSGKLVVCREPSTKRSEGYPTITRAALGGGHPDAYSNAVADSSSIAIADSNACAKGGKHHAHSAGFADEHFGRLTTARVGSRDGRYQSGIAG